MPQSRSLSHKSPFFPALDNQQLAMDPATTSTSAIMAVKDVEHLTSVARHLSFEVKTVLAEMVVIGRFMLLQKYGAF